MYIAGVLHRRDSESNRTLSPVTRGDQRLTLDSTAASAALQSLQCLSHIFSWVPLETAVTHAPASLLTKVFNFATFTRDSEAAIGEAALCCVNELLSKNQVPAGTCERFVLALFEHTLSLLKSVIHRADGTDHSIMLIRFDQLPNRFTHLHIILTVIC